MYWLAVVRALRVITATRILYGHRLLTAKSDIMVIWLVVFCIPEYQMSRGLLQWVHGLRCVLDLIMPFGTAFITTDYRVCKGLQLCDAWESSNYGAAQCLTLNGSCQGSNNNHCYPYGIWSGTEAGADIYYNRELKRGDFTTLNACDGSARCVARFAFGVRCVLDLYILFVEFS